LSFIEIPSFSLGAYFGIEPAANKRADCDFFAFVRGSFNAPASTALLLSRHGFLSGYGELSIVDRNIGLFTR